MPTLATARSFGACASSAGPMRSLSVTRAPSASRSAAATASGGCTVTSRTASTSQWAASWSTTSSNSGCETQMRGGGLAMAVGSAPLLFARHDVAPRTGAGRDARGHRADVATLGAMAPGLVHQPPGHHRFRDGRGADADAGVMATGGDHLDRIAVHVHGGSGQAQAGSGLERDRGHHLLAGGNAAEDAAGMVAGEAPGRDQVAAPGPLLR